MEKLGPSYTVVGIANWYGPLWKSVGHLLSKLKTELPYDLAIPLLHIYPQRAAIRCSNRTLYRNVHHSAFHSSQKVEST